MWRGLGWMTMACCALLAGCSTYQAYPGTKRPGGEVALLQVPLTDRLIVDRRLVDKDNVGALELLPGDHTVEWKFVYPNKFPEMKTIEFSVEAGRRYRLGQRFFPAPYQGGPLELAFNVAIDAAVMPFAMLFPPAPPPEAPAGEYYVWVLDQRTRQVLAGTPPDVPLAHDAISFVPKEGP